jgi:hypothetical protein
LANHYWNHSISLGKEMTTFKYGDEVIMKDRRLKYRLGKVLGSVQGGYEVLMEDKTIRYENESTIELRYEEED